MKFGIKTPDGTRWSGLFRPEAEGVPASPSEFWPVDETEPPEGHQAGPFYFHAETQTIRRDMTPIPPPTQEEIEDAQRVEQEQLVIEAFKSHPKSDVVADLVRRVVQLESILPGP